MFPIDLAGKKGIVFGVASDRSIAWAISKKLSEAGAQLAFAYQNERLKPRVEKLTADLEGALLLECDVNVDGAVEGVFESIKDSWGGLDLVVHCIAFAHRDDLGGDFSKTTREGFRLAMETSAYSLMNIARNAAPLMSEGGSVVALTFLGSERVFPGYNIMGTAKSALENEVRALASELGGKNIRVNSISAGPLDTLAARAITGFQFMKREWAERAPLGRNITQDEVAKAALFLLSDLASGVTGAVLPVDSGYHIMGV
jgi:enoyl-[acyl-carrier protein] reductase I